MQSLLVLLEQNFFLPVFGFCDFWHTFAFKNNSK